MTHDLIRGVVENNHRSISKAITLIENNQPIPESFFNKIYAQGKDAIRIELQVPLEQAKVHLPTP